MHESAYAIAKSLVSVAWADGEYADAEKQMLSAVFDAFGATEKETHDLHAYATERRTLEDVPLQDLSAADRRVLLQYAVFLSYADGHQSPEEVAFLAELATRLRIADEEAKTLMEAARVRAEAHKHLL
jgi:tellurite resistance protein